MAVCVTALTSHAADPAPVSGVAPDKLDHAITRTLEQPEYAWRLAREREAGFTEDTVLKGFFEQVGEWIRKGVRWILDKIEDLVGWLRKHMPHRRDRDTGEMDWQTGVQTMVFIVLAVAAAILGVYLYRLWKRRNAVKGVQAKREATGAPDLERDDTTADKLPWQEWMEVAARLLENGDLRLALRAMFLGSLAYLAHCRRLTIARHKSNREYMNEFHRKAHDHAPAVDAFTRNIRLLETVWYGTSEATVLLVETFKKDQDLIFNDITEK